MNEQYDRSDRNSMTSNRSDSDQYKAVKPGGVTYVAFLARALDSQARTLSLDMTNAATRVALLGSNGARLGTSRRLVAGLTAVVAKALLRSAVFCNVADYRAH